MVMSPIPIPVGNVSLTEHNQTPWEATKKQLSCLARHCKFGKRLTFANRVLSWMLRTPGCTTLHQADLVPRNAWFWDTLNSEGFFVYATTQQLFRNSNKTYTKKKKNTLTYFNNILKYHINTSKGPKVDPPKLVHQNWLQTILDLCSLVMSPRTKRTWWNKQYLFVFVDCWQVQQLSLQQTFFFFEKLREQLAAQVAKSNSCSLRRVKYVSVLPSQRQKFWLRGPF